MPKSRQRGGAKAHRKRIAARNAKLGLLRKQMQKQYSGMLEEKLKELEQKFSGETQESISEEIAMEEIPTVGDGQ